MKSLIFVFLFTLTFFSLNGQIVKDVISLNDMNPCTIDYNTDVVILNPVPFELSYLIEFDVDTYIKTIEADRAVSNMTIFVYDYDKWFAVVKDNLQSFTIHKKVKYILVKYKSADKIYLLIE